MCKRESSAKFEEKSPSLPYSADNNGQFAPFLTVDCRGLEFIGFDPRVSILLGFCHPILTCIKGTWKCIGVESGTSFTEVDLDEGEWVDYDEKVGYVPFLPDYNVELETSTKAALPVGVSAIESKWSRA